MKSLILVDADWIAFQMSSACQFPFRCHDGVWMPFAKEDDVFKAIDERMEYIKEQTGAKKIVMTLSSTDNWRHRFMDTYKGNRDPMNRPVALKAAKQYIAKKYTTLTEPGLEADDVMGIYATDPNWMPSYRKIIVTIDKDLKQIPAWHYNPEGDFEPWKQDTHDADALFFVQALAGDMTDGYSGCKGIGVDTAAKLLDDEPFVWERYEHVFKSGKRAGEKEMRWRKAPAENRYEQALSFYLKAGMTEDDLMNNGAVARILRHGEFDFKTNQTTFNTRELLEVMK
ncbi:exonuclease [Salinivibrio sp. VYel6]|uniref:exonuclease n=1 Tax=Salinivibrio sp. VYel6 TaxID=2490493 RepID=UPI001561BC37|nr:exonuclease [Salinivibrio sp. VYel6]